MKSKITSIETACEYLGYEYPKCLPDVTNVPEPDQKYLVNHEELVIIARALNTEYSKENNLPKIWEPDWNKSNQIKYNAYFAIKASKSKPSGVAFSNAAYGHWLTATDVAARLYFPNSELAIYFANQFTDHHIIDKLGIGTIPFAQ